jgi:hypothetical protein
MMRWVTFQAMLYKERVNHVKITLLLFEMYLFYIKYRRSKIRLYGHK